MTLKQRCQAGEAKLEQLSNALLDPRPEILEYCEAELQEVVAILTGEPADPVAAPAVSDEPVAADRADRNDLLRLRHRTRLLGMQVQNAVNLCQGWIQLDLSQGYTEQGRPAVPLSEPVASFEV
jgi:hypothetical protein